MTKSLSVLKLPCLAWPLRRWTMLRSYLAGLWPSNVSDMEIVNFSLPRTPFIYAPRKHGDTRVCSVMDALDLAVVALGASFAVLRIHLRGRPVAHARRVGMSLVTRQAGADHAWCCDAVTVALHAPTSQHQTRGADQFHDPSPADLPPVGRRQLPAGCQWQVRRHATAALAAHCHGETTTIYASPSSPFNCVGTRYRQRQELHRVRVVPGAGRQAYQHGARQQAGGFCVEGR